VSDSTLDHLRLRAELAPRSIQRAVTSGTAWAIGNIRALTAPSRWVCSGIGASEGVARATAAWMRREAGVSAEFRPFSEWLTGEAAHSVDGVMVFSQGLCPNARLAIDRAPQQATRVLITAATESEETTRARQLGWLVCAHEPVDEGSLLVRLDGPLAAMATGHALVESVAMVKGGPLSRAALDAGAAFASGMDVGMRAAEQCSSSQLDCVCGAIAAGRSLSTHEGLAWAWMEATLRAPIALWDALGFAHGPLQAIYEREAVLLGFERDGDEERALFDRVESVLARERHTLVRLKVPQRGEAAVFAHAGAVWGLLLSLLSARPRDLRTWPAKGRDGALYEVDGR
jgi:hypothetical protein